MFVASLSNIKMDCLGIRFYWLFICDRGPQSKSINQSAVAGSKFATNENIFCSFSVVFTHIEKMAMCRLHSDNNHNGSFVDQFRAIWIISDKKSIVFLQSPLVI